MLWALSSDRRARDGRDVGFQERSELVRSGALTRISREARKDRIGQGRGDLGGEGLGIRIELGMLGSLGLRERQRPGDGLVHRDAQAPDIGGEADRAALPRLTLLRSHVQPGPDEVVETEGLAGRAGQAQIQQARRRPHDDVPGLEVEMHGVRRGHVVQRRAEVKRERKHLRKLKRTVTREKALERWTFEVLQQQVRPIAFLDRVEEPHDDRVRETTKGLGLPMEAPQNVGVLDEVGPDELRDGDREQTVIPDEVDLVLLSPTELAQRDPARCDEIALSETPPRHGPTIMVVMRRALRITGSLLIGAGFVLLAYIAWLLWGTGIYTSQAQGDLRDEFSRRVEASSGPPVTLRGQAIARLEIPKIELDVIVVEGTDLDDLKKAPGHYEKTAYPWDPQGRVAIAGHRTTYGAPFWSLDKLRRGDLIRLRTERGDFDYRVTRTRDVAPTEVSVLEQTPERTLVLTTCTPKFSAAQRLIIFAEQVP